MLNQEDNSSEYNNPIVQQYLNSPEKLKQLHRRTLFIVVLSQIFGGAGLAAGITVGALIAQNMLGSDSYAGIPSALLTFGSAGAAMLVGRLSQRFGRRTGLASGFLAGGAGAVGVVMAAAIDSVLLLFASLLIYGSGSATNLQARYAGTDLADFNQRATAISIAMVSTTFGAVAGPNLVNVMGEFAKSMGVPSLAGPFILGAFAYTLAGFILLILLRPDPLLVAKAMEDMNKDERVGIANTESNHHAKNQRGIVVGALIMVLTQMVMVAIMTMTPVQMRHHGYDLREIGLVIGIHIGSMYLPSLITGILVDRLGRTVMAIASGTTLLAAGIVAAVAPVESMAGFIVALALLGIGWNFGLISGTALIIDSTTASTRAKLQGSVDVFISLSGASGGALSGLIVAHSSYPALSIAGGILSLVIIPVVFWLWSKNKNVQAG
ncbi:MFS transporter [Peribacillus saganii]|uniref:MFS transporter n=1 Tax=Peribacillus saganii TaxID=2303992 RepID=UPI001F40CDD5|nr:MFS transporter [Peribacillus saganii]